VEDIVLAIRSIPYERARARKVRGIFSFLFGIPASATIPLNHVEIQRFGSLSQVAMVDAIIAGTSKVKVDAFHAKHIESKLVANPDDIVQIVEEIVHSMSTLRLPRWQGSVGGEKWIVLTPAVDLEEVAIAGKLLPPQPNKDKIKKIIETIETDLEGKPSMSWTRNLFREVMGVPVEHITKEHPEVVAFRRMSKDDMMELVYGGSTKAKVDAYYAQVFPSLMKPVPDREKVERIVQVFRILQTLDTVETGGLVAIGEAQRLLCSLFELEEEELREDDPIVFEFLEMGAQEMADSLLTGTTRDRVNGHYQALFPAERKQTPDKKKIEKIIKCFWLKSPLSEGLPLQDVRFVLEFLA